MYLGSVGPEGGLLVVQLDGLGVEADGGRPVVGGKGLVALVLEVRGLRLGCRHVDRGLALVAVAVGMVGCTERVARGVSRGQRRRLARINSAVVYQIV